MHLFLRSFEGSRNSWGFYVSSFRHCVRFMHPELLAEVDILRQLGVDTDRPIEPDSPYRILSSDSIKTMASTRLIEFGAHTHHHAILSLLPRKQQIEEISQSIEAVQEITGRPCEYFAYPNGEPQ